VKVLHVFNRHRGGGGSDNAWDETIRRSRDHGIAVHSFERSSRDLPQGIAGKARAFGAGLYAPEAIAAFDRTLAELRPDIVHTHELYPLISPWIIRRARAAGVPVVHSCYDFRLTCPVATHYREGRVCTDCLDHGPHRAAIRNCRDNRAESLAFAARAVVARRARLFDGVTRFIVLSDFSRTWFVGQAGIARDRIDVNGCAIDLPETAVDPAAGGYVAFAGRFVPEKGVEGLIEAARIARLPLRLAGMAAHHPAIRDGDDIACVETPTRATLMDFYRGAKMLVVPSLWFETFAIVAAEAMAHGIPVIASDIGALADTVQRDRTGLLVPPGDSGALAAAMTRLWNDDDLCRTLGSAGRRRVATEFSAERHMARLLATYRDALADRCEPALGLATARS
jgi:glycosyltransferase involved in cell wall biosynthesis